MTKYSFSVNTLTTAATADGSVLTTSTYLALQGGSATQRNDISEVYMGGQATSSAPQYMVLSRNSTAGATPTALAAGTASNGPLDPAAAALGAPAIGYIAATTQPTRSNVVTLARLNLTFNAFGGIVRWTAMDPNEYYKMLGNTASAGDTSLSGFTASTAGPIGAHIVYETI
jgi:hypothetical protein